MLSCQPPFAIRSHDNLKEIIFFHYIQIYKIRNISFNKMKTEYGLHGLKF